MRGGQTFPYRWRCCCCHRSRPLRPQIRCCAVVTDRTSPPPVSGLFFQALLQPVAKSNHRCRTAYLTHGFNWAESGQAAFRSTRGQTALSGYYNIVDIGYHRFSSISSSNLTPCQQYGTCNTASKKHALQPSCDNLADKAKALLSKCSTNLIEPKPRLR